MKSGEVRLEARAARLQALVAVIVPGLLAALPLLLAGSRREQFLAWNSLKLAALTCLFVLPVGVCLAALLARTNVPGRRGALFLLAAMLFMPLYLQTAAWDAGFGRQGWYSTVVGSPGAPLLVGWRATILVHVMAAIPWVALIVAEGLRRVDARQEEAASLDADPGVVFWRITLPHAAGSVGLAALWVFVSTAGEFTVADMYQVNTYARELYVGLALGELSIWPGVAITVWLTIAATAFIARFARRAPVATPQGLTPFDLGWGKAGAVLLITVVLLLIAGVPLGNFVYQAGIEVEQIAGKHVRYWSLEKFAIVMGKAPGKFAKEIQWTFIIGGAAATASVVLAAPLAWLARRGGWRALPAIACAATGVAIPGPVTALGLIALLNRPRAPLLNWLYDDTIFAPTAAMLTRTLPWAILILWFAFRSIPKEILEAAELDGVGPLGRFWRIAAPLRVSALMLAWLVSFVIATGDLATSILVVPPGIETLAVRIFILIHAGVDDQVAAICLWIALTVFAATAAAGSIWRRVEV